MNDQDKRAVESLCLCGMDLETIMNMFPDFPKDEIKKIYEEQSTDISCGEEGPTVSVNCS